MSTIRGIYFLLCLSWLFVFLPLPELCHATEIQLYTSYSSIDSYPNTRSNSYISVSFGISHKRKHIVYREYYHPKRNIIIHHHYHHHYYHHPAYDERQIYHPHRKIRDIRPQSLVCSEWDGYSWVYIGDYECLRRFNHE